MAAFSAINVEPEENVDEEIDTTKDLQVDDALKLFQTALKLHAQGPKFFDQASDAYDALFDSEIFKYPESKTEYERNEEGQDGTLAIEPAFAPALDVVGAEADGIGSSLPQALYLSYKNHGQFVVDRIRHRIRAAPATEESILGDEAVQEEARRALHDFSTALDRDPSDAELWRKTARVAAFLTSARISRYSLEAAVELDDDPAVDEVEPPSLAEGFAGEQLKKQLQVLGDEMALSHPIMRPFLEKGMPPYLTQFMDPMPFLPDPTKSLAIPRPHAAEIDTPRLSVSIPDLSWTELGTILVRIIAENGCSGQAISIQLPDVSSEVDVQMEIDMQLQVPESSSPPENPPEAAPAEETVTEEPRDGEEAVQEPKSAATEATPPNDQSTKERRASMPTRKRSQSAAGIPDTQDDETADFKRSKRTRRRDTAVEEVMDPATFLATQLQPLQAADQNLFQTTKNLLENLGVTDKVTLERIAEVLDSCASDDRAGKIQNAATVDLRDAITNFDEDTATVLLNKRELPQLSLSAFLEHAKSGSQRSHEVPAFDDTQSARSFVEKVNAGWHTIHDVAYEYLKALAKTYTQSKWPDPLKTVVMQVMSRLDEIICDRVAYELDVCQKDVEGAAYTELSGLAQMLFELHLDNYERVANPNTAVDQSTMLEARCRLDRWMDWAIAITRLRNPKPDDELSYRLLWAAVTAIALSKGAPRDHVLNCWHSLRDFLGSTGADISLPNNTVMSEISTAAAEREISKLTTMDFFLGLFQEDAGDPVSVIESLEPVLSPEGVYINIPAVPEPNGVDCNGTKSGCHKQPITECASQELMDLWKFLKASSTELRLLLWSRLGEAYGKIQYITKQFSCFLRSIEIIIADFEREDYVSTPPESRRGLFMSMLKALDDLIIQSLHLALNDNSAFDIIDEDHLRSSMSALAKVSCLLHVAAMYEDETRIGMTAAPSSSSTLRAFLNKLQEMQVRTWSLQYTMLKVGIHQHKKIFPKPENDLADYLAAVHQVLGLRRCCKSSNKIFLKMMRVELLKQKNIENWEDYLGQVLYDLHGLKLGVGIWDVQDHGCEPENLERRQALQLVEKITVLANRMSMKDLLKSDLKTTIERMQQAIGSAKSSPQMAHNLRNYSEYLKAPIHPLHLYQALTGSVDLDAVSINTPESAPAKQGWFFLLGMIALTKFKGVDLNRRQTPGATDDLRIGATFLRLQLQYTPDRWDAWFRLAECFDYELDESVLWTADKMNKDRAELVRFQRQAIHSYIMALSHSYAWASDPAVLTSLEDDEEALYDMYHEFGMRMYSSSREPFAMEPFQHTEHQRFFIGNEGLGTYKKILHNQMSDYQVWKFAAHLFRKAMVGKPKDWKNPYMVAKCLWKMYQKPAEELDEKNRLHRPTVRTVLDALEKTIEVVSALPKPRHGQDPILEPHYKILSVVHKLVTRGDLPAQEGADILQRQPYAPDRGKEVTIENADDWEAYVIRGLQFLRDKDKSNWQHRIIMRHARILFDENADDDEGQSYVAAKAAFTVLRESMFTKTMVMNVWKCDAERPGRHHVYTERYIRYVVRLLEVMNDRTNLEAVLRRIRKKGADFYHFNELWQFCVVTYVRLLRQTFKVALVEEDAFKSLSPEDFDVVGEKVTEWATTPEAENNASLSAMKEAVELKKLNANLMKAGPIDDLITDCYSAIYLHVKPDLPGPVAPTPSMDIDSSQPKDKEDDADAHATELKSKLLMGLLSRDREPTVLGSLRAGSEQPDKDKSERHSVAGEAAPRNTRVGGIRRPNILRKAEQAVQAVLRAAEAPPKSAGGGGANGASTSGSTRTRMGSMSSAKNGHGRTTPRAHSEDETDEEEGGSHHGEDDEDVDMKDADDEGAAGERAAADGAEHHDDEGSEISSPPGSVHDSADDESDLSDVPADYEDDVPPSLLFPNLRRSVDAAAAAGTGRESSAESSEGEGEESESEGDDEGGEEGEGGEDGAGDGDHHDHEHEHENEEVGDTEEEQDEDQEEEGDGDDVEAGSSRPQRQAEGEGDAMEEDEDK
ncbi:Histone transcription regulator 3 [Madurella fahalii]|uniref:Histone transcription regulator 3 homolog n=1 Tax=Madurella fahalii TaxID=1157608 RepID=A0ABQ0GNQ2_9PEZI